MAYFISSVVKMPVSSTDSSNEWIKKILPLVCYPAFGLCKLLISTMVFSERKKLQINSRQELYAYCFIFYCRKGLITVLFPEYLFGGGLVPKSCRTLATPWTVACQAPLFMGFSRQEYWSGLPFPSPGDLPGPRIEPRSPALQADSWPTELQGKTLMPPPTPQGATILGDIFP